MLSKITIADALEITGMYNACFEKKWTLQQVEETIRSGGFTGFFMKGTGFVLASKSGDEAEIISIGIVPEERNKGYSSSLIDALKNGVSKIFLEVNEHNEAAIKAYEKSGFKRISVRRKYYSGKDDALVLSWTR